MKVISVLVLAAALSGCATMTPTQKRVAVAAGAIVVTGIALSAAHHNGPQSYCGDGKDFCGPIKPSAK